MSGVPVKARAATGKAVAAVTAAILLAGCAAAPVAAPATTVTAQPAMVARATPPAGAQALLDAARTNAGLRTLQRDGRLDAAAARHAADMQRSGRMTHNGSDGTSHVERIAATGLRACFTAENVAEGQKSVPEVVGAWLNSAPHRRNILEPRVRIYGLGRSGNYWAMVLAQPC